MAIVRNSIKSSSGGNDITVVANYSALPDPTTVSGKFYWCSASQGTSWLPGSLGGTYYNSGMYYSNGTTWEYINVPYQATQSEVDTGTNTDKFLTPKTFNDSAQLASKSDKELHLYQETDRSLSNATGAQNIFDTSTVSMLANSVYRFTLEFNMTGLSSTTNALNYIQLAFDAGTVGVSVFQYRVIGVKANQASSSTPQISSFNSTSLINVVLNTTATEGKIFVSGSIKTSTAGTFQPQVGMGVASSGVVKAGATFVAKILN